MPWLGRYWLTSPGSGLHFCWSTNQGQAMIDALSHTIIFVTSSRGCKEPAAPWWSSNAHFVCGDYGKRLRILAKTTMVSRARERRSMTLCRLMIPSCWNKILCGGRRPSCHALCKIYAPHSSAISTYPIKYLTIPSLCLPSRAGESDGVKRELTVGILALENHGPNTKLADITISILK